MIAKKIKVLHIYNVMNRGGAETFIMNVYRNADRKKYQFDFLCQLNEKGVFDEEIEGFGGMVYHFSRFNPRNVFGVIRETIAVIKKHGPYDAIYLPTQFYSSIYCIAAKIAGVKKIVVHSHNASDKDQKKILRNMYQRISRLIINFFATARVACGEEAGRYLFGNKRDFDVIHNGVDFARFYSMNNEERGRLRNKLGFSDNELVVGNIGRFAKQKNHDFFIDLAKELKREGVSHRIVLVGDGKLKGDFEKKIVLNNVSDSFVIVGVIDDPSDYLRAFDVFVLPSLYEGFPTVVVESLACGTPCVLSNTITDEAAIISDAVDFEDLKSPMNYWVSKILELKNRSNDKIGMASILKAKGYCATDVAKEMLRLYEA